MKPVSMGHEAVGVTDAFAGNVRAHLGGRRPEDDEGISVEQLHDMLDARVGVLVAANLAEEQGSLLGLPPLTEGRRSRSRRAWTSMPQSLRRGLCGRRFAAKSATMEAAMPSEGAEPMPDAVCYMMVEEEEPPLADPEAMEEDEPLPDAPPLPLPDVPPIPFAGTAMDEMIGVTALRDDTD